LIEAHQLEAGEPFLDFRFIAPSITSDRKTRIFISRVSAWFFQ